MSLAGVHRRPQVHTASEEGNLARGLDMHAPPIMLNSIFRALHYTRVIFTLTSGPDFTSRSVIHMLIQPRKIQPQSLCWQSHTNYLCCAERNNRPCVQKDYNNALHTYPVSTASILISWTFKVWPYMQKKITFY